MAKINQETIDRIKDLRRRGFIYEDIADIVGCNTKTVGTYAKDIEPNAKPKRRTRQRPGPQVESKGNVPLSPLETLAPAVGGKKGIEVFLDNIINMVTSNPQAAFGIGTEAGADSIAIIKSGLRIWDGAADWEDYSNFAFNLAGFVGGVAGGRQAFDKKYGVRPKEIEGVEIIQGKREDGVDREEEKIDAYVITSYMGGKSPIDVVARGICSMEKAKKLWHDYKEFVDVEHLEHLEHLAHDDGESEVKTTRHKNDEDRD